jgi:hypothetical protein
VNSNEYLDCGGRVRKAAKVNVDAIMMNKDRKP